MADEVRNMLRQRASRGHRHHLHAAADSEYRQLDVVRRGEQRHLGDVARVARRPGPRVRLLAVPGRVDVGAAETSRPSSRATTSAALSAGPSGGISSGVAPPAATAST